MKLRYKEIYPDTIDQSEDYHGFRDIFQTASTLFKGRSNCQFIEILGRVVNYRLVLFSSQIHGA